MLTLAVGAIASIAFTVSACALMIDWPERMEGFNFEGFEPALNPGRTTDGGGPMRAIYFWPYSTAVLGALATYAFGRKLYHQLRGM